MGIIFPETQGVKKLGDVEIDDLFIEESPVEEKLEEKEEYYSNPSIIPDEDFELESLEISDIDIVTFGEYEDFLNKYYDDNFLDINSKILRQIEFMSDGIIGQKMPYGTNAKTDLKNGINIGVSLNNISNFKFKNLNFTTNLVISYDNNQSKNIHNLSNVQILNIEPTLNLNLWKNLIMKSGVGLMSIKSSEDSNQETTKRIFGFSTFLGLQYEIHLYNNIHLNVFSKAKIEKSVGDLRLYNTNSTVESLIFGIGVTLPLYLSY